MKFSRKGLVSLPWIISTLALVAIGGTWVDRPSAFQRTTAVRDDVPVVLELFTSQGCSSCPPADALLSELGSSTKNIIPLAFHVDYWNHLGWSDPLSSHQYSERQSQYARVMNLGGEYTPQTVIAGEWECVGSDRRSITRAIAAARTTPHFGRISLVKVQSDSNTHELEVDVMAQVSAVGGSAPLALFVVIYENGIVTKIGAGENGGRKITYDYTVRKLVKAAALDPSQDFPVNRKITIAEDPSWSLDHVGVAAFIQDPVSLKIGAATSRYPIVSG
jgi:hypothetical protein